MGNDKPFRKAWVIGVWSFWCVCVAVWTVALLTTYPVEVSHRVLPREFRFPVGKCLHVGAYAFLTVLAFVSPPRSWLRWLPVVFLSLHGFTTEYIQNFVGRSGEWRDVGLDHLGIALGLAVVWAWRRWRGRRDNPLTSSVPASSSSCTAPAASTAITPEQSLPR
jgi:VanZ family protein